jgi:hypothetical protein
VAKAAYHKPDNVKILDMHRGVDTSEVRFPPRGCCQPPELPRGMLRTIMLRRAKEVAKAEMKASGIKRAYIEPREVFLRAQELMQENWAQFEAEAMSICVKILTNEQQRRHSNRKAISVQKSGAE